MPGHEFLLSRATPCMDEAILRAPHSNSPLGLLHGLGLEAYVAQMGIMNNR